MPRYVEVAPSKIKKGDICEENGRAVWYANADAEKLEDGRVTVNVAYYRTSTLAQETSGTAEWPNDDATVRLLRRRSNV